MFAGPDLNAPIVVGLIQSEIWAGNATVNEIIALANTLCLAIGGPLISVEVSVPPPLSGEVTTMSLLIVVVPSYFGCNGSNQEVGACRIEPR